MHGEDSPVKRLLPTAALAVLCTMVLTATASPTVAAAAGTAAATAASTGPATYHGTPGSAARLKQAVTVSSFPAVAPAFRNQDPRVFPPIAALKASSSLAHSV